MSFTDGKPWTVTEDDMKTRWGGIDARAERSRFRCLLCGHRFEVGDTARWVYLNSTPGVACGNAFVCSACDGLDVVERIKAHSQIGRQKFWWMA